MCYFFIDEQINDDDYDDDDDDTSSRIRFQTTTSTLPLMALNSLYCADVPLSNYSFTHFASLLSGICALVIMLFAAADICAVYIIGYKFLSLWPTITAC